MSRFIFFQIVSSSSFHLSSHLSCIKILHLLHFTFLTFHLFSNFISCHTSSFDMFISCHITYRFMFHPMLHFMFYCLILLSNNIFYHIYLFLHFIFATFHFCHILSFVKKIILCHFHLSPTYSSNRALSRAFSLVAIPSSSLDPSHDPFLLLSPLLDWQESGIAGRVGNYWI